MKQDKKRKFVFARGKRLWCRLKDESGKWFNKTTGYAVGDESKATRYARAAQAALDKKRCAGADSERPGSMTVSEWAKEWIPERRAAQLDWKNDEARLRHHVLPVIGDIELADLRKRHLIDLFKSIRAEGKIAPRTIHNVYSVLSALLRDAEDAELIDQAPAKLTSKHLGRLRDKDPTWRGQAVFTRDEVESLISDDRIPEDRRMLYGLDFLAGIRHGESAALRWRHYDASREPLGELRIELSYRSDEKRLKPTKTGAVRRVPVHPTLAAMLAEWRLGGWQRMVGRPPTPEDLIVPMPPADAAKRKSNRNNEPFRDKNYSGKRWREVDLPALGLRLRRKHDTRATLISLACDDGADPHIIETRVTHTRKSRSAFDGYNRGKQWEVTCAEIAKLRVVRKRGVVVPFRYSAVTVGNGSDDLIVEAPGVEPIEFTRHHARLHKIPSASTSAHSSASDRKRSSLISLGNAVRTRVTSSIASGVSASRFGAPKT